MTAADPAARSDADGPALGEKARESIKVAYDVWSEDGIRTDAQLAEYVVAALEPHVATLLAQARAAGAAEERGRVARHLELTADASSSHHNAAIWRAAAQTVRSMS